MKLGQTIQLCDRDPESAIGGQSRSISPVQAWVRHHFTDLSGTIPPIEAVLFKVGKISVPSASMALPPIGGKSAQGWTAVASVSGETVGSSSKAVGIRDHEPSSGPK